MLVLVSTVGNERGEMGGGSVEKEFFFSLGSCQHPVRTSDHGILSLQIQLLLINSKQGTARAFAMAIADLESLKSSMNSMKRHTCDGLCAGSSEGMRLFAVSSISNLSDK